MAVSVRGVLTTSARSAGVPFIQEGMMQVDRSTKSDVIHNTLRGVVCGDGDNQFMHQLAHPATHVPTNAHPSTHTNPRPRVVSALARI